MRLAELAGPAARCAVAWLAAACLAVGAARGAPAETLRECAHQVRPPARGLEALSAQCPGLKDALAGLVSTLPDGWEAGLTPGQLEDLAAIASRYQGERPGVGPDVSRVRAIVDALVKERGVTPKPWWQILREWLRSWFAGHDRHELSWVKRWLKALSGAGGVLGVVAYVLVALVVVGSLVYIVLELRSSGVLERTARRAKPHVGAQHAEPVDLAQAMDQPALLLALLVAALKRSGRLTAERHLTHRELARAAALDDATQRPRLDRLTGVAEELLYGARRPAPEAVERAIQDGRELLRELAVASP